jgi:hypothetical protein
MSSVAKEKQYPCRFFLPNGESVTLAVAEKTSVQQIKKRIWLKKGPSLGRIDQHTVQLRDGDVSFSETALFSELLRIEPLFFIKNERGIMQCEVVQYRGDALQRQNLKPDVIIPCSMHGYLAYKTDKKLTLAEHLEVTDQSAQFLVQDKINGHKAAYFGLYRYTLFKWESEQQFRAQKPPLGYVSIGSTSVVVSDSNHPISARFSHGLVLAPLTDQIQSISVDPTNIHAPSAHGLTLSCKTSADRTKWVAAFQASVTRRLITIVQHVCQEISNRNALGEDGIFRVSGNKQSVDDLLEEYEAGYLPDLKAHALTTLTSLGKLVIRQMQEPMIPASKYRTVLNVVNETLEGEERIETVSKILNNDVSKPNQPVLRFLLDFLKTVSTKHSENRMDTKNLAVVFSPTLLRDTSGNLDVKAMGRDSKAAVEIVKFMIDHTAELWPKVPHPFSMGITASFKKNAIRRTVRRDRRSMIMSRAQSLQTLGDTQTSAFLQEFAKLSSSVLALTADQAADHKTTPKEESMLQQLRVFKAHLESTARKAEPVAVAAGGHRRNSSVPPPLPVNMKRRMSTRPPPLPNLPE